MWRKAQELVAKRERSELKASMRVVKGGKPISAENPKSDFFQATREIIFSPVSVFGALAAGISYLGYRRRRKSNGGFFTDVSTELAGIAITVLMFGILIQWQDTREQKAELIRDTGSRSNEFALHAVSELAEHNWLYDGSLHGASLYDANLAGANLRRANFKGANLTDADLTGAHLGSQQLSAAILTGADLSHADLTGAFLGWVNLTGADLFGANLIGTNLAGANLMGVNLTGTNLKGTDLTDAQYTNETIWPEGFNPKAAGAINADEQDAEPE